MMRAEVSAYDEDVVRLCDEFNFVSKWSIVRQNLSMLCGRSLPIMWMVMEMIIIMCAYCYLLIDLFFICILF